MCMKVLDKEWVGFVRRRDRDGFVVDRGCVRRLLGGCIYRSGCSRNSMGLLGLVLLCGVCVLDGGGFCFWICGW